jgi:hypothetical protein
VPIADIEAEYWRLVGETRVDVEVEYGSEVRTAKVGSGFPMPGPDKYGGSEWNLLNMAKMRGSLLRYVGEGIDGVTEPWLYIGMVFTSFCWFGGGGVGADLTCGRHIEDHFLYSVNYLHDGDPKLWSPPPAQLPLTRKVRHPKPRSREI